MVQALEGASLRVSLPSYLYLIQCSQGTQAGSGSRDDSTQVKEVEGNKIEDFSVFSLISNLCLLSV